MSTMCICIPMPKLLQNGIITRIVTVVCIRIKSMYSGVQKVKNSLSKFWSQKYFALLQVYGTFWLNDVKQLQKYCSPGVVTNVDSTVSVFPVKAQVFIKG